MEGNDTTLGCLILILAIGAIFAALYFFWIKPNKQKQGDNSFQNLPKKQVVAPPSLLNQQASMLQQSPKQAGPQPLFSLDGVQDLLQVFDDRVEIVPRGLLGFMNKGVRGVKEIPFHSITAVQFKESGMLSGYLQFTIPGGNENRGGILDATKDENTFIFSGPQNNAKAIVIKQYINSKIKELRTPSTIPATPSLSDEIQKLANLRAQGIISDQEFQSAKDKLIK